jgi:phenylalanyl-tRNA synthetase beta chain
MRTSLVPGLLDAAARARRHGREDVQLFTVGARYLPSEDLLPEERLSFAAVVTGARPSYLQKPVGVDVWDAKGLAEAIVQRFTRRPARILPFAELDRPKHLHPRGAARVLVDDVPVGSFGPLHPEVAQAVDLDSQTLVLELDAAELAKLRVAQASFREIPRFPASRRDLAVVVHDDVQAGAVLGAIREAAGDLAEHVELFDRFIGGAIPKQHASLAFRVVYRSPARTLTDAEVDERHSKVVAEVERTFGAQLRGS